MRPTKLSVPPPPRRHAPTSSARLLHKPPPRRQSHAAVSRAPVPKLTLRRQPPPGRAARGLLDAGQGVQQQARPGRQLAAATAGRALPLPPCEFGPKLVFVGSFSGDQASVGRALQWMLTALLVALLAGSVKALICTPVGTLLAHAHMWACRRPTVCPSPPCSAPRWAGWCCHSMLRCPQTCGGPRESCGACHRPKGRLTCFISPTHFVHRFVASKPCPFAQPLLHKSSDLRML